MGCCQENWLLASHAQSKVLVFQGDRLKWCCSVRTIASTVDLRRRQPAQPQRQPEQLVKSEVANIWLPSPRLSAFRELAFPGLNGTAAAASDCLSVAGFRLGPLLPHVV